MFKLVDPHLDFPNLEEEILKFWEADKTFEKSLEATKNGKPFTFYDGPPFATGLPHYGHILASTIKDVIPRYQTMRGRFVRRRWGWDCHGLPIEEIVERKLKISGKKQIEELGIGKFNEICREEVLKYAAEWGKTIRRIARWVEFDDSYKTMDREYMESVWWAFKQIYDKGLVYEGRKVLLYCPRCETPISNFEVAMDNSYQDVTEEAVTVKFKVKNTPSSSPPILRRKTGGEKEGVPASRQPPATTYLLAWTTTPWTLVGNVALAVGEQITYVIFKVLSSKQVSSKLAKDKNLQLTTDNLLTHYIIAKDRLSTITDKYEIVRELSGADLVGLEYEPLYQVPEMQTDKSYKVYAADFVNTEEGTGIVHTAVVYGEEDYNLGLKVGLPVVPLLDEKGKFNDKAPELVRGRYFKDSEKLIKKDLEDRGLMYEKQMHRHSYPHCWRCGTMLYYNAIPAWFIDIQKLKAGLLTSNQKEISWFPEHLKLGRYQKSVEMAPDWNISRNRYWGNPMPVWKCEKCQKNTVVGSIKELQEKQVKSQIPNPNGQKNGSHPAPDAGSRVLDSRLRLPRVKAGGNDRNGEEIFDLHRPYIDEVILKCEHCGGEARRITEIFDSWMEAGSMPFAEYHYPFTPILSPPILRSKKGGEREGVGFPFPAQFVAEYIAQTRAWFYVTHVISLVLFGHAPFENVVTTGTILAEDGSKMSKSKNNFPDPRAVIEKYGADSLRFYLMNSAVMQADNLNFSERDLATANRKVVRILWNVYNYFVTYANSAGWQPTPSFISPSGRGRKRGGGSLQKTGGERKYVLDQWITARTQELINEVGESLDSYNTVRATRAIEAFVNDLSTWYVRRSRGRVDEGFFVTLHATLLTLSKVIAPFMPYLSEEIYRNLSAPSSSPPQEGGEREGVSVHLESWPKPQKLTSKQQSLLMDMQMVREEVEQAHAQRAKSGIKLRQILAVLETPNKELIENEELKIIVKDEVNVREVVLGPVLKIDTTLTAELKIAGLARELERQIQEFRKDSGLTIGELVDLAYETESANMKEAMAQVDSKKTYLKSLQRKAQGEKYDFEKDLEIESDKIKIALKKISNF